MSVTTATLSILDLLADLKAALALTNVKGRLILTDDIKNFKILRERALQQKSTPSSGFFFGVAVPAHIQTMVDDIVRTRKQDMLELLDRQVDELHAEGLGITFDQDQDAYLIHLSPSEMGFYISARPTRPRRVQGPKPRAKEVKSPNLKYSTEKPADEKAQHPLIGMADVLAQVKKVEPKAVRPSGNGTARAGKSQRKSAPSKRRRFTVIRTIAN